MDYSNGVLGTYQAQKMQQKATAVLLKIGRDVFTRADLAKVDCFNFTAAATLSAILNRDLRVKDIRDVYDNVSPAELAIPRIGAVAIAVLGAAFEAKRIGGDTPLSSWVKRHHEGTLLTFDSFKHKNEEAQEQREAKKRKTARTHKARGMRADRLILRAGATT